MKDSKNPRDTTTKDPAMTNTDKPRNGASASDVQPAKGRQYLVATKLGPNALGFQPQATLELLDNVMREDPEIEVLKTLTPRGMVGTLAVGSSGPSRVFVARMSDDKAEQLRVTGADRGVVVEPDHLLRLTVPFDLPGSAEPDRLSPLDIAATGPIGGTVRLTICVLDSAEAPVANAQVVLYGNGFPAQGITDNQGNAELVLPGNTVETIRALYVKPVADAWNLYMESPALIPNAVNRVHLQPLGEIKIGWGQRAMNLDKLPANITGRGVKIAVIDSGVAVTHPLLQRVSVGTDVTNPNLANNWQQDVISHGTHCAGVIGGGVAPNLSMHGFAPEADVLAVKIFPGGRFSDLIDALDYCISQQADVVNLSLGSDQPSEIVEQKLQQAKSLGIACIVAAGNSGGPVQSPARSPHVLAVSAIGKLAEFPAGTYHSQTILGDPRLLGPEGYFAAKFSCFGDEVGVCGPGVAIISSVPPANFAAWDGTSMATPHVTGLAALLLAHHVDFSGAFKVKNAQRVNRLFQILRDSARPIPLGDPRRTGAGLPDALRAFGLPIATAAPLPQDMLQELGRLLAMLQARAGASPAASLEPIRAQLQTLGILSPTQGSVRPTGSSASVATAPGRGTQVGSGVAPLQSGPSGRGDSSTGSRGNGHKPASERELIEWALAQMRARMQGASLLPAR